FGDVFRSLPAIAAGTEAFVGSGLQDGRLTALGCAQNWAFQQPIFDSVTADLRYHRIADLGCGAAARLIHLVSTRPEVTGIGVDLSPEACDLAVENVKRAGLDERITILQADLLDVVAAPERYPTVVNADLVTSYFILHHFVGCSVAGRGFLEAFRAAFQ